MKPGTVSLVGLILCLPRMWSCGPAPVVEVTRTDSLGIRVVTYPPLETMVSPSTPSTTRELRIGGSDASEGRELAYLLGRPAILGCRLYLTDSFVDAVRAFDLEGGETRAFGSAGQGPGEFRRPAVAGTLAGDSVVIYDSRLRRVTILDGAFRGARIFTVPSEVGGFAAAVGVLSGGHLVFSGSFGLRLQGRERLIRDTIPIAVTDMEGAVVSTFEDVRTEGIYEAPPHGALQIPFMPGDRVVAGPSGVYVASEDRAEVRGYDANGSPRMILRFGAAPVPVGDAQIDSVLDWEVGLASSAERVRRLFSLMPIPEEHPPIARMIVDELGRLWIRPTPDLEDDTSPWFVFESDGTLVGSYTLPPGELIAMTSDRAVLLTYDEYDAPIVDVHRITDWR